MGRTHAVRRRALGVSLAAVALAGTGLAMPSVATPAPSSTEVTLTSGSTTQSEWLVVNDDGTLDGTPTGGAGTDTGGDCPNTQQPGLAVEEGTYDVSGLNHGDAVDGGQLIFVNHKEVVAPGSWDVQVDPSDNTLNRVVTTGPTAVGGLNTTVEYRALPTQQVLRSTVFMTNPGATSVTVPVVTATNFGSDNNTLVQGTSSGDTSVTDADRWLVTSDNAGTPSDAVNTSVLAGPGQVAAPPTATSQTVFDCAERNGIQATFNVTIPAGSTRALMFFNELSGTNAAALASALRFNANPGASDELLTGLSDAQRASIVNWKLAEAQQPDALIRRLDSTKYLGNNIYNTTGKHQTVKARTHRGHTQKFRVRLANDGKATATFTAHGLSSTKGVRVRYFANGVDVTAAMTSSAGLSFTRTPGTYLQIKVKVTVKANAKVGSRKFAKVMGSWTGSGFTTSDVVAGVVTVS